MLGSGNIRMLGELTRRFLGVGVCIVRCIVRLRLRVSVSLVAAAGEVFLEQLEMGPTYYSSDDGLQFRFTHHDKQCFSAI
jgi:hypothetical protein